VSITSGVGSAIAVAINGTVDPSTNTNALIATGQVSGEAILTLTAGDVLTLRNNSAVSFTLDASPGVSAQFKVLQID
jgi:hypothetical protein